MSDASPAAAPSDALPTRRRRKPMLRADESVVTVAEAIVVESGVARRTKLPLAGVAAARYEALLTDASIRIDQAERSRVMPEEPSTNRGKVAAAATAAFSAVPPLASTTTKAASHITSPRRQWNSSGRRVDDALTQLDAQTERTRSKFSFETPFARVGDASPFARVSPVRRGAGAIKQEEERRSQARMKRKRDRAAQKLFEKVVITMAEVGALDAPDFTSATHKRPQQVGGGSHSEKDGEDCDPRVRLPQLVPSPPPPKLTRAQRRHEEKQRQLRMRLDAVAKAHKRNSELAQLHHDAHTGGRGVAQAAALWPPSEPRRMLMPDDEQQRPEGRYGEGEEEKVRVVLLVLLSSLVPSSRHLTHPPSALPKPISLTPLKYPSSPSSLPSPPPPPHHPRLSFPSH